MGKYRRTHNPILSVRHEHFSLPNAAEPSEGFRHFFLFFLIPLIPRLVRNRREAVVLIALVLNPFLFAQSILHGIGQLVALLRTKGSFPEAGNFRQQTTLCLPFAGTWLVANGGVSKRTSHSWGLINQRYAYDFCIADESGRASSGNADRLEDYYAFGQSILAPADGVVLDARDGIRDCPHLGQVDLLTRDFRGNFVVIGHTENEFSFFAHLMQGSVTVKRGERVRRAQLIARCGNSGHSTEPHLHFALLDHPNDFLAVSMPVEFSHFISFGETPPSGHFVQRGYLSKGQRVRTAAEDTKVTRSVEAPASPAGT